MKVLILALLVVGLAAAIPVDMDSGDESQLTLVDLDNEQSGNENSVDATRSKRFILKKIALVKAGALGIGALGLAGIVAAKNAGGGPNQIQQDYAYGSSYGSAYGYNPRPTITTSYPSTYVTSQTYVPSSQTYIPPQPQIQQPLQYVHQQPSYIPGPQQTLIGGPISSALAWKAGVANNIASGFVGSGSVVQSAPPSYSYGPPPPPPAAAIAPVPNKPLYVVCDNHN